MTSVKTLKRTGVKALSWLMILAMLASLMLVPVSAAPAAEIEFTNTSGGKNLISLSEARDFAAALTVGGTVDADSVRWTLSRETGAQDAALYPYQYLGGALGDWTKWNSADPFFTGVRTTAEAAGSGTKLTLTFSTELFLGVNRVDSPRGNRNVVLDYTGDFTLRCLGQDGRVLGETTVRVAPYDDYNTYSELVLSMQDAVAASKDVSGLYMEMRSLGTSTQGYDMPYVVIADSKASINNYLAQTERALRDPEAVLGELKAGTLNYKVPVMFSNIHPDETNGADAPMNFIWDVVNSMADENGKITYKVLTGFTAEGEAQLQAEMAAQGLHWSELIQDYVTGLGFIKGGNTASGVVDLEKYYTVEEYTFDVKDALKTLIFIVCPTENADGRVNNARQNGNGFDINRDNMFQTQVETQNMTKAIAMWSPLTFVELHGFVSGYQVEPCSPPHEPNFEYDLFAEHGLKSGEAFGIGAVANNDEFNSYVMPLRDYLETDENGDPYWAYPWDDMSTNYTPQYSMLHGTVAFTIEVPVANQESTTSLEYGLIHHAAYVAENAQAMYESQLTGWVRGMKNEDVETVRDWYVDMNDRVGAEAEVYRPKYPGNDNFFPEAYVIPLDAESQTNLAAAYAMEEFLLNNGVVVHKLNQDLTIDGVTYQKGSLVVSMYQAKRNVANGALYNGVLITGWTDLYSEPITAFGKMRGFTCDAIDTVGVITGAMLTKVTAADTAKGAFAGVKDAEVIIDNDSVEAIAMTNAMLADGVKVGFVTMGDYAADFVVAYSDYEKYSADYVVKATGVESAPAANLLSPVKLYIPGFAGDFTKDAEGNSYGVRNYPNYGNTNYNFDRFAYGQQMGFEIVQSPENADVIVGNRALDAAALSAVKAGTPYLAAGAATLGTVKDALLGRYGFDFVSSGTNQDALYYVEYGDDSLTTAGYANRGDNLVYSYGGAYIVSVPAGAKTLMTATEDIPLEGFMMAQNLQAFLGSVQAIEYQANGLDITVFAGSLTNKAHQQDDYQFAANTIYAKTMGADYATGMTDISGHWAYDDIRYDIENGLFSGTSATTFSPNAQMTRGMIVTVLGRMSGVDTADYTDTVFGDVDSTKYYAPYIAWAQENEIVTGRGLMEVDGETVPYFAPDAPVTREELAQIFYNYAKFTEADVSVNGSLDAFTDAGSIGGWAVEALEYAVGAGLIRGTTDTTVAPKGTALRGQVAAILARLHTSAQA